jgi:hypothetical protein
MQQVAEKEGKYDVWDAEQIGKIYNLFGRGLFMIVGGYFTGIEKYGPPLLYMVQVAVGAPTYIAYNDLLKLKYLARQGPVQGPVGGSKRRKTIRGVKKIGRSRDMRYGTPTDFMTVYQVEDGGRESGQFVILLYEDIKIAAANTTCGQYNFPATGELGGFNNNCIGLSTNSAVVVAPIALNYANQATITLSGVDVNTYQQCIFPSQLYFPLGTNPPQQSGGDDTNKISNSPPLKIKPLSIPNTPLQKLA